MGKRIEERVIQDVNGFWLTQRRFMPLDEWEPGDGWRTIFISSIRDNAMDKLTKGGK